MCIFVLFIIVSCTESRNKSKSYSKHTDSNFQWCDNFDDKKSLWDWSYNNGTGYKKILSVFENKINVVEGGITRFSDHNSYSDCS